MASAMRLSSSLLLLLACAGCEPSTSTSEEKYQYPELDLSNVRVDFDAVDFGLSETRQIIVKNRGQLPMGISSIALNADEMEDNFSIAYSAADITCPKASAGRSVEVDSSPLADTGPDTGDGTPDSGDPLYDTASGPTDDVITLGPKCKLPVNITMSPVTVGRIYSSLRIETVTQEAVDGEYPEYYWDPDNAWKIVILEGVGVKGTGNLIISPRTVDFGHLWVGESAIDYISIQNVGEGDLTLGEPYFTDCDPGFAIESAWSGERTLAAGTSALVEVSYTPTTEDPLYCDMTFTSDDEDAATVDVTLQANVGDDPENVPPTVAIRQPKVGTLWASAEPLEVEINAFDENQPATTLTCKVKSTLAAASLATCTPSDESGHVIVEIDPDDLEQGIDTLLVTVTDDEAITATASTTLLYKTPYPDDDDDGDGYGDISSDPVDCDDTNDTIYPYAAELYDLMDNDCDGTIDEGTEGYDDDGDTVTEADGDCNDTNDETYPGAPEESDQVDNNCNGVIDEGTSRYDDDEDGFSEVENDCDDDDATVNPAAVEYCDDDADNDCNGLKDNQDGCVTLNSEPLVIGGIELGNTAIGVGQSATMSVFVYDADGQELNYSWQQDAGLTALGFTAIDNPTASSVNFTAPPELPDGSDGETYSIYVIVMDEDGHQTWAFEDITVYPEPVQLNQIRTSTSTRSCGSSGSAALWLLPALGGLLAARRRRDA